MMRIMPVLTISLLLSVPASANEATDKVAKFNWMMNCQGCHQANGAGSKGGAPDMRGIVSKFLSVDGGREYLAQVPGVAYAPMGDDELAELVNWLLKEYDNNNLPSDFVPFTGEEIGILRKLPLVEDAPVLRTKLLAHIKEIEGKDN